MEIDFNDPVALQVMWNRLVFITDQADLALGRTAFSPIVRENHDYVTVLMDPDGNALAQCTLAIPVFISTLPMAVKEHFFRVHPPGTLKPGDVLATNDARIGTGHPPDLVMVTPIFHQGRIVAYAGCIAHLPDVGGRPQSPDSVDVFEEGIRLPILKFFNEGVINQDVFDIIASSSRLPEEVLGDINSMVAANEVMRREVVGFLEEYRLDTLTDLARAIYSRSEDYMRRAIREVPDGVYRAEMKLDGVNEDVTLKAAVHVIGDRIHVDYAGTSGEVENGINVAPHYRIAHSLYALKCLLDPTSPNNEGCAIPCTDEAPEGSILNPRPTAAGAARNLVGHTIPSLIFRAMAEVLPDRVQADSGGAPIWGINCTGVRANGQPFSSIQNFHGGQGGRSGLDGNDTLSFPSNCKVTPVEIYERSVPVVIESKELIADSGGAGEYRGGLGQRGVIRNISGAPMSIYMNTEHVKYPCFGVLGGSDGAPGRVVRGNEPAPS
ncbi:hydantoinase B/oxoprolinase family protein [Acidisphaera sp. S103]|uniref:hydantoinase B/oxoprolinase family protein n=1 Tax=Acidisphaera sp. S103 TaxID=1747223 RepID=UPI001C204BE8|nr:hydantoinase B/oxoprolinase family protein [Acidisphaera sp. S103]